MNIKVLLMTMGQSRALENARIVGMKTKMESRNKKASQLSEMMRNVEENGNKSDVSL